MKASRWFWITCIAMAVLLSAGIAIAQTPRGNDAAVLEA